jgi:hypothetical protein
MTNEIDFFENNKQSVETKITPEKDATILRNTSSPEEQARRFEEVLNDPPVAGYGRVELWSAKDTDGNNFVAMPHDKGEIKAQYQDGKEVNVTLFDPLFELDLKTLFEGQLAEVPMNVIPNLMDEFGQLVSNEEKDWKPEKPKKDFTKWYWVIVGISFIPVIGLGIAMVSGMI